MEAKETKKAEEEVMEQHELSSTSPPPPPLSSLSSASLRQCRICHDEEDEFSAAMESPCGCSGSLKYAHRGCVQRWCDEKGSTLCEICLQNFESDYTIPPKKVQVVETAVTVSDEAEAEAEEQEQYAGSEAEIVSSGHGDCSSLCRSLMITFTIILLVWHLIAVVTIEAADHCAFSLLTMYLLRAAGILLPFYAIMRMIQMIPQGQRQYQLQLLEEQRRTNASNLRSMQGQEQQQLVISVH